MANKIKTEAEWMAEEDARTMAHYEEIMSDSKRKAAAVKAAVAAVAAPADCLRAEN